MKKLTYIAGAIAIAAFALVLTSMPAQAVDVLDRACQNQGGTEVCQAKGDDLNAIWRNITNTLLFIIGAVAVIMIVIGAIKYTTSNGDSAQITSAKNTILYAVVGLILAVMAGGIVNFVLGRF